MIKSSIAFAQTYLLGLTVRTNNTNEFSGKDAKIGKLFERYYTDKIANQIQNRKNPGVTIIAYTDYDSDENGDYTFFIGEEVFDLTSVPKPLTSLIIPNGKYQKFTTNSGKIPDIITSAWQEIWKMTPDVLGGQRNYQIDFQIHDLRANDINNAVVDIFIGIK